MIPRRLIRTVPAETSDDVEGWWDEWCRLHPGWEHVTFRDPIRGAEGMFLRTFELWDSCTSGAQRAGLIRLDALMTLGGVYLDSDVQPLGMSLEPLLHCSAFAAWEDENTVPDAVIGAEPGHPAIAQALAAAFVNLPRGAWQSGPGVTTRIFPGRTDVLLLPPVTFYGVHYNEGVAHSNDAVLDRFAANPPPYAFGLHRWHASWLAEQGHPG